MSLYLLDVATGAVCARRDFPNDCISLAQNGGIHLLGSMLSVVSLRTQTIHIMQVKDDGRIVDLHRIGRNCFADDDLMLTHYRSLSTAAVRQSALRGSHAGGADGDPDGAAPHPQRPRKRAVVTSDDDDDDDDGPLAPRSAVWPQWRLSDRLTPRPHTPTNSLTDLLSPAAAALVEEDAAVAEDAGYPMVSGLKQRLLAYLYREARTSPLGPGALRRFYASFEQLANLRLWRAQFVDPEHLLLRYAPTDLVTGRTPDASLQVARAKGAVNRCRCVAHGAPICTGEPLCSVQLRDDRNPRCLRQR